ncbi:phage baseplate assembly protein [Mannheimia massilioguelmaensis]|uniref:phage baseplate assembly protein n=1 Tax=Mannheimia massilioguelmaensis TaxID=1604354 RepID=UPI0005CB3711|nr:tail protein [Mannheimia massilioguelmaensis]
MSASGLKIEVNDEGVSRYRPLVIIADDNMTGSTGYQRAQWEKKRNNAEAKKSTATVQGWTRADGSLWLPNELVLLTAAEFGIQGEERLIVDVEFALDDQGGTITNLTLMHRDAFDEPPEPLDDNGKKKSKKSKKAKKSKKDNVKEFTDFE